jgi:hypothetical protein
MLASGEEDLGKRIQEGRRKKSTRGKHGISTTVESEKRKIQRKASIQPCNELRIGPSESEGLTTLLEATILFFKQ